MYDAEKYGGRSVGDSNAAFLRLQFPSKERMDAWLANVRGAYSPNSLTLYVDEEALIVTL